MQKPVKKVVLVDDNPADIELTRLAFEGMPNQVELLHFQDGESFFSMLPALSLDEIHYVLLDLNMPKMNGFAVLKKLQENRVWRRLPVIVLSSSTHTDDVHTSYDLGANAYVVKPFDLTDFDRTIQVIDDFWSKVNIRATMN